MSFKTVKVIIVFLILSINQTKAQVGLDYYLPEIEYNEEIPTPKDILGFQIGEWHVTHGQILLYLEKLCDSSPNCFLTEYARSHEHKPLIYLTISSEKNIKNIEEIRKEHVYLTDPTKDKLDVSEMPIVLYQGYSIHGNESSGANAALLNAYYLLAGQSDHLEKLLSNSIILLDPVYNPDGLQRFSTWANSHKHSHLVTDTRSREFNEVWPGGRTNHYWFDLNRDWLFNIHPSSKGRIETFHKWKPDVLTDHHEMGSNSTFFFQPGIPSRTNLNTPQINQAITEEIGHYHAQYLDSIGSLYYTKESFDDYYYGKGSTYPDINGCIGILFEQASSRGHLRETNNGIMSFPFTIRNQMVTSLSTQKAALDLKNKILNYKQDFFHDRYKGPNGKGYYIFESSDFYKLDFFINLLNRHKVNVYKPEKSLRVGTQNFDAENSFIVPKNQAQSPLIKTIFETVHTFNDSLFYDVSAWTIPLALNMKYGESNQNIDFKQLEKVDNYNPSIKEIKVKENAFAVAINWSDLLSPTHLYKLLEKDLNVKTLSKPTSLQSNGNFKEYAQGTLIVPLSNQPMDRNELVVWLNKNALKYKQQLEVIDSGLSKEGFSLGSPQQSNLEIPKVAMIVGEGVNAYEAGDNWYHFDHRFDMPITMIDKRQFNRANLNKYNVIIMADGRYGPDDAFSNKLINWVDAGGTIISMRRSISYLKSIGLINKLTNKTLSSSPKETDYSGHNNARGAQVIGGAIFEAQIDRNHPLFFGYENKKIPVFKRGTQFYNVENEKSSPMVYTESPLLSGYSSKENLEKAKNAAAVTCYGYGGGRIIALVDNPNFRAYWLGGSQLFANAIFFSGIINSGTLSR